MRVVTRNVTLALLWLCTNALAQTQLGEYYYYQGQRVPLTRSTRFIARQLRAATAANKFPNLQSLAAEGISNLNSVGEKLFVATRNIQARMLSDLRVGEKTKELVELPVFDIGPRLVVATPQVIVQFKNGTDPAANKALLAQFSKIVNPLPGLELYLADIENPKSILAVANMLHENSTVLSAEPNFMTVNLYLAPSGTAGTGCPAAPAIPPRALQWNYEKIRVEKAWAASTGASVKVAILDDGVDFRHPALASRKQAEWDAVSQSDTVKLESFDTHGTRVAGIIAAEQLGESSFRGIAPASKLISVRVGTKNKYYDFTETALILRGIEKARSWNADILNFSIYFQDSDVITKKLAEAAKLGRDQRGIVVVAATGNDGGLPKYPAYLARGASDFISVGASDENDGLKKRNPNIPNDWGSNNDADVTIAAPGLRLVTTAVNGAYDCSFSGTSSATPQVAGIVALLLAKEPALTAKEVKQRLRNSADKPVGLVPLGRVNACRALQLSDCN